jgi:hypothetical protein
MGKRNQRKRLVGILSVLLAISLLLPLVVTARPAQHEVGDQNRIVSGDAAPSLGRSHRLIVQLQSPPLAEWSKTTGVARSTGDRLDAKSPAAQAYLAQLEIEQADFIDAMDRAIPEAAVATYIDAQGRHIDESFKVVFNGMAIDPGAASTAEARGILAALPGVRAVFFDNAHDPDLYASVPLINAPAAWDNPAIGGMANAGDGIRFASMDGGIHHDSPMFDGTGYTFPAGYPPEGSDPLNDNGKIITSRAYFRPWDPPAAGDENTWPGEAGTSHGVHTGSTAAGIEVDASYVGVLTYTISGVAPAAYVMSYRVFYESVTSDGSFYDAEGVAALEDIVLDGAQVLNNSWGGGPSHVAGGYDPIDLALINAANAGVFVSMAAGNSGPSFWTTDYPSPDYIGVAASTTDGTIMDGAVHVTGPQPVPPDLLNMPFTTANFGGILEPGDSFTYTFTAAAVISPTNFEGCNPWPADTFVGKAALISRGECFFADKIYYAQEAGAEFVVIYNHAEGGDTPIPMGCGGDFCAPGVITIAGVMIGHTNGLNAVDWYDQHPADAELNVFNEPFQSGNTPDRIVAFSSRGPGQGFVLKPDIAAPGVNIMAQGYDPLATGEARHLGYGQASGTSMAAPHVAGAAILLRQIHPDWSNAEIKSALMSTSKYIDIYNYNETPAQPLDMGAGRLDLTNAADPGVLLDPPSLSYGLVPTGTVESMVVNVTSVATTTQNYTVSLLYTGDGFPGVPDIPGFSVDPTNFTLAAGESVTVEVTFDSAAGMGYGNNQGYIVMTGDDYDAHMPAWALVTHDGDLADVLIIDNDGSANTDIISPTTDYLGYYTETVEALGYSYDVLDVDALYDSGETDLLDIVELLGYRAVVYFTGDNVFETLSGGDQYDLNTYFRNGGGVIATGQNLAATFGSADAGGGSDFYTSGMGGDFQQDSVTGGVLTTTMIMSSTAALPMAGLNVDVGLGGDGAANQDSVDEIAPVPPRPAIEIPPLGFPDPSYNRVKYNALFEYPDATNEISGTTGIGHSDQPMLEKPGRAYYGRTLYFTFGMEGVNDDTGLTTRAELLQRSLDWLWDDGQASSGYTADGLEMLFTANFTSTTAGVTGYSYRWDFGDGTHFSQPSMSDEAAHVFYAPGTYDVRVEVTDSIGNRFLATIAVETDMYVLALPRIIGD